MSGDRSVRFVEVYGGTHSPWVQSVLLGLEERGIKYSLRSTPPLACLKKWGVLMPAVSIDGAPWQIESSAILAEIGFDPIPKQDLNKVRAAWQGVLHRPNNPFLFFNEFSRAGDSASHAAKRSARNFLRAFIPLYMLILINVAKRVRKLSEPADFGAQFLHWESLLQTSGGPFLGGDTPSATDIMLFGVIQCHSSIPVPPLDALLNDARLPQTRQWILTMQRRLPNYPYVYSASHFASASRPPVSADPVQRCFFFAGLAVFIAMLPITLAFALYLMWRVPR